MSIKTYKINPKSKTPGWILLKDYIWWRKKSKLQLINWSICLNLTCLDSIMTMFKYCRKLIGFFFNQDWCIMVVNTTWQNYRLQQKLIKNMLLNIYWINFQTVSSNDLYAKRLGWPQISQNIYIFPGNLINWKNLCETFSISFDTLFLGRLVLISKLCPIDPFSIGK